MWFAELDIVFVGVAVDERHFFEGEGFVGVEACVECANAKELGHFFVKVLNNILKLSDDHEYDFFEDP